MDTTKDLFCFWVLDVRDLWYGDEKPGHKITVAASAAIEKLSKDEQVKACKFYFLRDAKLSVGSSLLKRLFVSRTLGVPWEQIQFSRQGNPRHGKPCYAPRENERPLYIDFNVSHQAGIVALVGCCAAGFQLGVDITCVNERNDGQFSKHGEFEEFVDMHEEVFSTEDIVAMKSHVPNMAWDEAIDAKKRRFYAYWALKEAYVKLEGEALLAPWLRRISFRNVKVPPAGQKTEQNVPLLDIEVWFDNAKRKDVAMFLESHGQNYLIATAVKRPADSKITITPTFENLDLEKDVLPFAVKS